MEGVEIVHQSGLKFHVNLSRYEIDRANTDEQFQNELCDKYYNLYCNNLVSARNELDNEEPIHLNGSNVASSQTTVLDNSSSVTEDSIALNMFTSTESSRSEVTLHRWTVESTKLLLNLRLEKEEEFNKPVCKKNKLWSLIASKMNEIGGYNITGTECYSKYRNLLQTYRQNKEKRLKKTGEGKITWDFFEIMDAVLGNKAASAPPISTLSSSINVDQILNETDENIDETTEGVENVQQPRKRSKRCSSSKKELSFTQYLYIKSERDATKWEEKKTLKEKEIEAINNLADAIRHSK